MNILVLGGTRFVGLRLVKLLIEKSHRVTVLNRGLSRASLPDGVAQLIADRSQPAAVRAALSGKTFDAVIDTFAFKPEEVQPVLDGLAGAFAQYILCGSTGYYMPTDVTPIDEEQPVYDEADKIQSEQLLLNSAADGGFTATVIRPPVVYGPCNPITNRESSLFAQITHERPVVLTGTGASLLHPIHVDDLAAAFERAAGNDAAAGRIYNVAARYASSQKVLVSTIAAVMGMPLQLILTGNCPVEDRFLESRDLFPFGHDSTITYNSEKIRYGLGWQPQYSLRDGLAMTYQWWLDEGLDKIEPNFEPQDELINHATSLGAVIS